MGAVRARPSALGAPRRGRAAAARGRRPGRGPGPAAASGGVEPPRRHVGPSGGARDSHEDVVSTALRESAEEAGLDRAGIRSRRLFVDDHGGWSYTTVHADVPRPLGTVANDESTELRWVAVDEVDALPLHPGFALTWPQVRARPAVLLVDAANIVGSRPDGWWRDRPGAASRLLEALVAVRAASVLGPGRAPRVIAAAEVVLEGQAVSAADPRVGRRAPGRAGHQRRRRPGRGRRAARRPGQRGDRGLGRPRAARPMGDAGWSGMADPGMPGSVHPVGPRWLFDVLEGTALPRPGSPSR